MKYYLLTSFLWTAELANSMDGPLLVLIHYFEKCQINLVPVSWLGYLKESIILFLVLMELFNAFLFCKYLSKSSTYYEIVKKCKSQLIICWDNASIHKSKTVKTFWRKKKIRVLWITPYSPWLNPVEGYIGWIKLKLASYLRLGR